MWNANAQIEALYCKLKLQAGVSFLCRPYILVKAVVLVVTYFLITGTYEGVFM